ncbi:MAG: DNA polymerase III subunit alpha [Chitinophagaceae bacterium]
MQFSHLHNHTQYSLLDGASSIKKLYQKAIDDGMPAMAITDHGNMYGVFEFVAEAYKHVHANKKLKVKPIVGCEFYVVEDITQKTPKTKRHHQVLLAKNTIGYQNLLQLSYVSYIEGFYVKPCIDKSLIKQYANNLIATTCCLGGYVPQTFILQGEKQAEEEFKWWLDIFGEDYYVELQRHTLSLQDKVNEFLLYLSKKYNIPVIATNDSHYIDKEDAKAHDILLCVNTGSFLEDPKKGDALQDEESAIQIVHASAVSSASQQKGFRKPRFAFPNEEFYMKTTQEMKALFADIPEAIDNTNQIIEKIDILNLKRDILLPAFPIPQAFDNSQDKYLVHLVNEGLRKKYTIITPEIEERVKFELETIRKMGFSGYFLIVSDFIKAAREMDVLVGPGRGSAAGSVVAYCMDITTIDPIKYNLLFERFLNPDRKSMPDIDTDFDDKGRDKVINYVVQKYGDNQVAQIITYGTMAARASIKDVGRVLQIPIQECNMLTTLIPNKPGIKLDRVLYAPIEGLKDKEGLNNDSIEQINSLRKYYKENAIYKGLLEDATKIEGTIRNVGLHAAGIIIAPDSLNTLIPVCKIKDSRMLVTQIEGSSIEDAGIIKMDFLGLSNLNIIKEALKIIKERQDIDIDIQNIPLNDKKTFELYQQGATNGIFQFESEGMQKYLRELRPNKLEDLIAMNALYRPGPIQYIPNFINRKHGIEPITYDLPEMEEFLRETYGITIYQEQVMLLSQKLANFTKGEADILRKAMGKKQKSVLDKMKTKFIEEASKKLFPKEVLEKIWTDWEAFAQYAFNKSHSTCYAYLSYQTAYLKANYPHEYMAALLNNAKDIDKVSFFIEECKRMKINVLPPDINESDSFFSVTSKLAIRFGLSRIKNIGEDIFKNIFEERKNQGYFKDIFDFSKRVINSKLNVGKLECLIKAGAFDCFKELHRAQYFATDTKSSQRFIDKLMDYGKAIRQSKEQPSSLFSSVMDETEFISTPTIPQEVSPWSLVEMLNYEREMTGIYLSKHPLDIFDFEMSYYNFTSLDKFNEYETNFQDRKKVIRKNILIGGFITLCVQKLSVKGTAYAEVKIQDKIGKVMMRLFGENYTLMKPFLELYSYIYIIGFFQEHSFRKGIVEFKISEVGTMEEFRNKFTKEIQLFINADKVEEKFIKQIKNQLLHPGSVNMSIHITNPVQKEEVVKLINYPQKGFSLSDEFCNYLQQELACRFKIITK